MNYDNYRYDQLKEALESADKSTYPEQYAQLENAVLNYPADKIAEQDYLDQVSTMGLRQLRAILPQAQSNSQRDILDNLIFKKQIKLSKIKVWLKWLLVFIASTIPVFLIPVNKLWLLPLPLAAGILSCRMAIKQHRALKQKQKQATSR